MSNKVATTLTVGEVLNIGARARLLVLENGVALEIKDDLGNWVRQTEWIQ